MSCSRSVALLMAMWLVLEATANPVRRSPDLEARRRSAITRSMIRFGRSSPPELSAAELLEAFERPTRRGSSFLRFGRSEPKDKGVSSLQEYDKFYLSKPISKKSASFIRFGRDPSFVRFGRSMNDDKIGNEQNSELVVSGYPQRKGRARDHFIRLGRDSEELENEYEENEEEEQSRRKRSAEECQDCEA